MTGRFGYTLIAVMAASMLICMFPLTRSLSKIAGVEFLTPILHHVWWRVAMVVVLVCAALSLHLRGYRWSWAALLLVPVIVWATDIALWTRGA